GQRVADADEISVFELLQTGGIELPLREFVALAIACFNENHALGANRLVRLAAMEIDAALEHRGVTTMLYAIIPASDDAIPSLNRADVGMRIPLTAPLARDHHPHQPQHIQHRPAPSV